MLSKKNNFQNFDSKVKNRTFFLWKKKYIYKYDVRYQPAGSPCMKNIFLEMSPKYFKRIEKGTHLLLFVLHTHHLLQF